MARCPDCNKFVSLDSSQDPEVTVDVDGLASLLGRCPADLKKKDS